MRQTHLRNAGEGEKDIPTSEKYPGFPPPPPLSHFLIDSRFVLL